MYIRPEDLSIITVKTWVGIYTIHACVCINILVWYGVPILCTLPRCMALRLSALAALLMRVPVRLLMRMSARSLLLALHRTAVLRHDEYGQETLLNLLLRNYLHYNLYDQARTHWLNWGFAYASIYHMHGRSNM